MTDQKRKLLTRAIESYGPDAQAEKALEELGELISALARMRSGDPRGTLEQVAEEIADVRIMIAQLCILWGIEDRAVAWEYHKLARLRERLDGREA